MEYGNGYQNSGRGGFGGGVRGTCYNCNEPGHQARDCPKGTQLQLQSYVTPFPPPLHSLDVDDFRRLGDMRTFEQIRGGEKPGHLSRDCPEPPKGKACYRCGETGHLSRECPQQESGATQPSAPAGGVRSGSDCYKCGKIGHIARNCPMNDGVYGGGGYGGQQGGYNDSAKTCYACGGFGHMAKDCTQGQKCYNCGRLGHVSRDCDQAAQAKVCYRCQQPGHISRDCTNDAVETS